ncbi:MAG: hypothetical protein SOR77_00770, partial [Peptoniphilus sp.]|uniref:hypothetical protein n=1 Tax=Peptoniphilus sp. TaxID=1971214 RepID=UPI002A7642FC
MKKMYKGIANSPATYLKEPLKPEGTVMYIADSSILPELPNLAVIGTDQNAETVLVKDLRSDGGYTIQRAVEGIARDWQKTTEVARNFTNYDYEQLIANIEELDKNKLDDSAKDDFASKTDIKTKLSELADDSTHRLVTDSEKDSWNKKQNKLSAGTNVEITSDNRINVNIPKVEVVNDLITGGADKALSAEQGKVLFQNVDNGKRLVANAIIDKGQTGVTKDSTFSELATKIKSIKTGYSVGDVIDKTNLKPVGDLIPKKSWEFTGHSSRVNSVAVDTQGNIYSGGSDKKVMKISPSGTKIWEFTGHSNTVKALVVDTQGNIYSGSDDKKVMKISPSGTKIWEFTGHSSRVNSVAVDTQGNIYSGGSDKKVMKISPS